MSQELPRLRPTETAVFDSAVTSPGSLLDRIVLTSEGILIRRRGVAANARHVVEVPSAYVLPLVLLLAIVGFKLFFDPPPRVRLTIVTGQASKLGLDGGV